MFPILEWMPWGALVAGAIAVLRMGFYSKSHSPSFVHKGIAIAIAAVLPYPIAAAVFSAGYVRNLRNAHAEFRIDTQLQDWSPSLPRATVRGTAKPVKHDGRLETNPAPDPLEYYETSEHVYGIREYTYRLVDQRTAKVLLAAHYFSSPGAGPLVCEAAPSYWRLRQRFVRKAWDDTKA